jgi:hypothetical protein
MTSTGAASWLRNFYTPFTRAEVSGDDLGTTYGTAGAVILAAILTASRSPERLAELTGLPTAFVDVVLANMDRGNLWHSENCIALCNTLRSRGDDHDEVECAIHSVLEFFWSNEWLPGLIEILPALRGTCLLFGRSQTWIDEEFLECALGPELVYGAK